MTPRAQAMLFATDPENRRKVLALVRATGGHAAGHTFYSPSIFRTSGTEPMLRAFCHNHAAGTGKQAIFDNDGNPVDHLVGIHGLELLRTLCDWYGLSYQDFHGRGTQAEECYNVLVRHLSAEMLAGEVSQ